MVLFFLQKGAKLDSICVGGNTVLHYGAESGNIELLELLINCGCCRFKHETNIEGFTPIDICKNYGWTDCEEFLKKIPVTYKKMKSLIDSLLNEKGKSTFSLGGSNIIKKKTRKIWKTQKTQKNITCLSDRAQHRLRWTRITSKGNVKQINQSKISHS